MSLHAKIRMKIPLTAWSQHLWRGGGGRTAARSGQVRAGPASGRDWEDAFPPSLARTGRELGRVRLISCPAHCPPHPSSAFLIHSEGSGLCFQHISKGSQAGSFWNFPWELVSLFLPTKRQKLVGMEIMLPNGTQQACQPARHSVHPETELCHAGGPGHHLASALGVTKAPLLLPRPTQNRKSTGGGEVFLTVGSS